MIRKMLTSSLMILAISLLLVRPAFAAKSYFAEYFDVQIDLQEGGSAIVTETVKFHFEGDPFTFAFREISADGTDGLTFLEASMDGVTLPQGTGAGQVEVEEGDPLKVTWHFPPAANEAHVFVVRYRAEGVVRTGQADTLVWRAIPEEHEYNIDRSTITLTYPATAAALAQPVLDWNFDAAFEEDRVTLSAANIGEDEDVVLTARFAPGSLTDAPPQWQVRQERAGAARAQALPAGLAGMLVTLFLGGLALLTYIRTNGRELSTPSGIPTPTPPADVPAAIIGKLTGQSHTAMGAIFHLAQRGALEVRQEPGTFVSKKHLLVRTDRSVALQPFEQGLMEALFMPGEDRVDLNEVGSRLGAKQKLWDEPLEQELVQRGWLDTERKQRRAKLIGVALIALLLLAGMLLAALLLAPDWNTGLELAVPFGALMGVGAGLFLLALALLIYAGTYSILTPAGEEQAARWKGFAGYLKQVGKGREPAIRPDFFERYLAYASAFGLGGSWAKYFEKLGNVPLPVWFRAGAGSDPSFTAFVVMMAASDSSGAGGGGSAGAGGASGGGSSGAG